LSKPVFLQVTVTNTWCFCQFFFHKWFANHDKEKDSRRMQTQPYRKWLTPRKEKLGRHFRWSANSISVIRQQTSVPREKAYELLLRSSSIVSQKSIYGQGIGVGIFARENQLINHNQRKNTRHC